MNRNIGINVIITFLVIAIIILGYSAINDYEIKKNGIRTEGIVMYITTNRIANRYTLTSTSPIVSYTTQDGKIFTIQDCESCHKIGDKVPVIYDPVNPADAAIDTNSSTLNFIYYLVGFIGFLIFYLRLKKKRNAQS